MRRVSFDSVETLVSTLHENMKSWQDQFREMAKKLKVNASAYGFLLHVEVKQGSTDPIIKLNSLLDAFSAKLPPYTFWFDTKTPVFIIDEANELNALKSHPDGHAAIHNLFKWLVMNTKERNKFHVILSSSDSFFHLWVSNYVGANRYKTYIIGDLTPVEANAFWQQWKEDNWTKLVTAYKYTPPIPSFNEVYKFCGGNIFLMKEALEFWFGQYATENMVEWKKFPYINQEKAKLIKAYYSSYHHVPFYDKSRPRWSKDDLITTMDLLVTSPNKFVVYSDLCEELVVDSLIEHIIHLRPVWLCSHDLTNPPDQPVVTVESPCGLVAMEDLLKQFKI